MKKKAAIFLLAVLLLFTMAMATYGAGGKQAQSAPAKTITWALGGQPEVLDPAMSNYLRANAFMTTMFMGLVDIDKDGNVEKIYARDYTVSQDGMTWDFHLVPNAKWSDGVPLTAHHFEYGIKRMIDPANASRAVANSFYLKNAERANKGEVPMSEVGVKAISDTHLRFELSGPYPYFVYIAAGTNFFPARKDIIDRHGDAWTKTPQTYIGNGPFQAVAMSDLEYRLAKNPNFIKADDVKIDELKIVVMESQESHLAAYRMGDIDVTEDLSPEAINSFRNTPDLAPISRMGIVYFNFNHYKDPLKDVRVRKALSMAINREQIITRVLQLAHRPAFGLVPFGMPSLTNPARSFRDLAGDRFKEDVAEARRLLAEAGFPGGAGMRTLVFYTMNNQVDSDTAQAIQSMWKENLGVNCEINALDSRAYWAEQPNMDKYDIFRDSWNTGTPDPDSVLLVWEPQRQSYQSGYTNPEYDRLWAIQKGTADPKIREDAFLAIEKLLIDDMALIPYYFRVDYMLIKPRTTGVFKTPGGHFRFHKAGLK